MMQYRDIRGRVTEDDLLGDLVGRDDPRFGIVWINAERMGGTQCFFGTRIPVQTLFDYLEDEGGAERFRRDFPDVSAAMVADVLGLAGRSLLEQHGRAP